MGSSVETIIDAKKTNRSHWKELWHYRELFGFLAWRDIIVQYKQAVIGILWSLIRPVLTMVVFTVIFGKLAKLPSEGVAPYPLMVFAALLPWQFFANAVQKGSDSLIANAPMITKIYFPRVILPLTSITTAFIDLLIAFAIYCILMVYYQVLPDWRILALPFFAGLAIAFAAGLNLCFSALNVVFRDFKFIVPFAIQLGLYISPVGFSSATIPDHWRLLYSLNPMVGVIDGFRWALLGQSGVLYWPGLCLSIFIIGAMLLLGRAVFKRMELIFSDRI